MAEFPTAFSGHLEVLTPESGELLAPTVEELAARGLVISLGLQASPKLHNTLKNMANEPHIQEFCPNDAETRFGSFDQIIKWRNKGRALVTIHEFSDIKQTQPFNFGAAQFAASRNRSTALAYGWSGYEKNKIIDGADVTTAYRVGARGVKLGRQLRAEGDKGFRLGLLLGKAVVAASIEKYGVDPKQISLETWQSNKGAVGIYNELGFYMPDDVEPIEGVRPTVLHEVGDIINGNPVHLDDKGNKVVKDYRLNMRLNPDHFVDLMAA